LGCSSRAAPPLFALREQLVARTLDAARCTELGGPEHGRLWAHAKRLKPVAAVRTKVGSTFAYRPSTATDGCGCPWAPTLQCSVAKQFAWLHRSCNAARCCNVAAHSLAHLAHQVLRRLCEPPLLLLLRAKTQRNKSRNRSVSLLFCLLAVCLFVAARRGSLGAQRNVSCTGE
jgi:hypothetical protein